MEFTKFEIDVINMLLKKDNITFKVLREQFNKASVSSREFTGVGFFTNFYLPENIKKIDPEKSLDLGNVHAKVKELNFRVDFVLFINEGKLDVLEGYTCDDLFTESDNIFPESIKDYELYYNEQENQYL